MREIRTLRATWRGLETWCGSGPPGHTGAPALDPTDLGLVPKQISTGDRTILGSISRRGNRYLRSLFVQAAWVVLVKVGPKHWDRYGLKSWIEAAKKRQ